MRKKGKRYYCESCGLKLRFKKGTTKFVCYCGEEMIEESEGEKNVEEKSSS